MKKIVVLFVLLSMFSCEKKPEFDTVIRNGLVYDGSGKDPVKEDIGINADTIAFIGDLKNATTKHLIDAKGMAVSPGFIDVLSQSMTSLIYDGRSMSAIKQGVTLEVFGEGESEGPYTERMKRIEEKNEGDIKYKVQWTSLREYLLYLQNKGVSTNVASFVGAATIRENVLQNDNRKATSAEVKEMQALVKKSMREGALGIGSALIYAPGSFADTDELTALCKAAQPYGGVYISHIRSEGNQLLQASNELIQISKEAKIPAVFYHLKAAGRQNWNKEDALLAKIDSARAAGLDISACMYTYTAGATGFDGAMSPGVQAGGLDKWIENLKDPLIRKKTIAAMKTASNDWENLYLDAGAENIICTGFKQDSLKYLSGKRLADIARMRHQSPEETIIDLVINDHSRVEVIYFLMSEENVRKLVRQPWMSFCSDNASIAPEGLFLKSSSHPRSYGNFARLFGKYVREEKLLSLQQAIHQLTELPATQLNICKRGKLAVGNYADVVVFDPSKVIDKATYKKPHQLAVGVSYVLVNGVAVLKNGRHTGAKPGRAVFGAGSIPK
jgi:N-acyl-D-amino-acid deacylase